MVRGFVVVLFLSVFALMAQDGAGFLPFTVRIYLELTDTQQRQIIQVNTSFNRFRSAKSERSSMVKAEIDRETREANPDALALGLRYRELEAIRREIDAEQKRTVEAAQAVLTPAQKQKLTTLQEALQLQSTACDALNYNLMAPVPLLYPGVIVNGAGGLLLTSYGCNASSIPRLLVP